MQTDDNDMGGAAGLDDASRLHAWLHALETCTVA